MMTMTMMLTAVVLGGYDGETIGMLMTRCCGLLIKFYERNVVVHMLFMFHVHGARSVLRCACCLRPLMSHTIPT